MRPSIDLVNVGWDWGKALSSVRGVSAKRKILAARPFSCFLFDADGVKKFLALMTFSCPPNRGCDGESPSKSSTAGTTL